MKKFYGKIEFIERPDLMRVNDESAVERFWSIDAEPHVMLRMRRIFERVSKTGTPAKLSHSPENCRDLKWFLERYAMEISDADRQVIECGASNHADHILTLEQILDPNYRPREFKLAMPLRDYQARATELYLAGGCPLLGDDVGLGKTATGIGSFTDARTLPGLIVGYPHLQFQLRDEVLKFLPSMHVHVIKKSTPYELPKIDGRGPDVIVCTYNKLHGWCNVFKQYVKSVIFDEAQELRHNTSDKYKAAKIVADAVHFKLGASATPVYGYGGEIFNIMEVLAPGRLGTREEFVREWC